MLHLFNSPNHLENAAGWNTDMPLSTDYQKQVRNIKLTVTDFKKAPSRAHLHLTSLRAWLSSNSVFLPCSISGKPC